MQHSFERPLSFFIAGTMQGSRTGAEQASQSYRAEIKGVVLRHCPNADILCPLDALQAALGAERPAVAASHAALATQAVVRRADFDPPLRNLTSMFQTLSRAAGNVDVLIAYLPNHEASMGTAIEMWNAFERGVTVIAVTPMRQNLALLATSTVIVPSLDALDALFEQGLLEQLERKRSGAREANAIAFGSSTTVARQ